MRLRTSLLALLAALLIGGAPQAAEPLADRRPEIAFRKELAPGFDASRWALGVVVALGAGLGALWLLRRRLPGLMPGLMPAAGARRMKLVESLRVSARTTVLLVEVDGRTLVLGEHAGALVLLSSTAGASGA